MKQPIRIFFLVAFLLTVMYPALGNVPEPSRIGVACNYRIAPVPQHESIPEIECITPSIDEWSSGQSFSGSFTSQFGNPKTRVPVFMYRWIACHGNPINAIDPDGRETIFIHGTWADPETFSKAWKQAVLTTLRDVEYDIAFDWGGGNTRGLRSIGAEMLFGHIWDLHKAGKPINLVAHSHGGNVALETITKHVESYNKTHQDQIGINNLILLGTPIRDDYLPDSTSRNEIYSVGTFNLISNDLDCVQNEGGYNKHSGLAVYPVIWRRGGEHGDAARKHLLAKNIFIDYKTMYKYGLHFWQYTYAHSMPKENVELWNEFIAPKLDLLFPGTGVMP